jgi:hypothetical protein
VGDGLFFRHPGIAKTFGIFQRIKSERHSHPQLTRENNLR